ncbi:MAG: SlyX family protein [Planctomycetota bacterium]
MSDEARIIHLEEKVAYLEKHIGDLDEVIRDLAGRLRKHGEGVDAVRKMLEDHLNEQPDPGDERPPHW